MLLVVIGLNGPALEDASADLKDDRNATLGASVTAEGIPSGCGIRVPSGTSCETAAEVRGHFFSAALEADPWKPVVYEASADRNSMGFSGVATGLSSADITASSWLCTS